MKKALLTAFTFLIPSYLFSKDYCIYIDDFKLNLDNKSKIYSTISDIAYPSFKIQNNQIFLYSGKFKKYEDANKLLYLTRSRYPKAKVASCERTTRYNGNNIIFDTQKNSEIAQQNILYNNRSSLDENYCLKIYQIELLKSAPEQSKIKYILQTLPEAYTKVENGNITVYSGKFKSLESAKVILNIVKKEFNHAQVTTCKVAQGQKTVRKSQTIVPSQKQKNVIQTKTEPFTIESLDDEGLISKEIASGYAKTRSQEIKKADIRHALDVQKEENFNGLYFKINGAWDTLNNTSAYDARLEFDIFDQGYYQIKKNNEKNEIENKINFLKTLKNIEVLKKEQELLKIKKYSNSINVASLLLKLRLLEANINDAKQKMDNGLITSYEYEHYVISIQQIKDELLLFKNMTLLKIPKDLWNLLNQIEHVRLIDENELLDMLEQNSVDLKLAKTLQEKKPLLDDWSDKLRVNLYIGQRKMYLSQNQNLIGIEAKIPLSNYSRTKELEQIQDTIASSQAILQHSQTREILKESIATFKYKQQKLKTYSYELSKIKEHVKNLHIINNSAFAAYAKSNFEDEQESINNYFDKYTQIQQERIKTYKELINILYLIHSTDIKDILLYALDR